MKDIGESNCYKCEFYHQGMCKKAENSLASMNNIGCLLKCLVMLLVDLNQTMADYVYEDDEDNKEI
jgi:hypothetical protein